MALFNPRLDHPMSAALRKLSSVDTDAQERLGAGIARAKQALISQQHADGYWC